MLISLAIERPQVGVFRVKPPKDQRAILKGDDLGGGRLRVEASAKLTVCDTGPQDFRHGLAEQPAALQQSLAHVVTGPGLKVLGLECCVQGGEVDVAYQVVGVVEQRIDRTGHAAAGVGRQPYCGSGVVLIEDRPA